LPVFKVSLKVMRRFSGLLERKLSLGHFKRHCIHSLAALALWWAPAAGAGQKTWIVVGDSIMSKTGDGQAKDFVLHLITQERNVLFRNISSPGASLGGKDYTGFNNPSTIATFDEICGALSYCDGILIQAGANDFQASIDVTETEASIRRILAYVRSHGKKAIVTDIIWFAKENQPNALGYPVAKYREVRAASCIVAYSDVCVFASRSETPLGSPSTTLFASAEVMLGRQVHPNIAGHRALADWIEIVAASAELF
jgi:hypothetical protein